MCAYASWRRACVLSMAMAAGQFFRAAPASKRKEFKFNFNRTHSADRSALMVGYILVLVDVFFPLSFVQLSEGSKQLTLNSTIWLTTYFRHSPFDNCGIANQSQHTKSIERFILPWKWSSYKNDDDKLINYMRINAVVSRGALELPHWWFIK